MNEPTKSEQKLQQSYSRTTMSIAANLVNQDEPIYTISIATQLVRPMANSTAEAKPLHAQTLRTYEREGLVKPKRVGRNRLYSERDIERLRLIQHYTQNLGVNLAGVEIILDMAEHIRKLETEIERLKTSG